YELLTGKPPLRNDGHSESAPLPRPQSHITRVVPRTLEPIIRRALADDPGARYQTATELGRELRRWSLAQRSPGYKRSPSAFLLLHFDAEREGDDVALRARLERVPADPVVSMPVARSRRDRFDDLSEHTPPRGQLMNELAATMSGLDS